MKKNLPLIIAVTIPILMVLFVLASVYIPRAFVKPEYGFIYAVGDNYSYGYGYGDYFTVTKGKVEKVSVPCPAATANYKPPCPSEFQAKLYIYDAAADTSREINVDDAQKYNLDTNQTSPDGFRLERGGRNNGIFEIFGGFDRNEYNAWYLKRNSVSKRLNLQTNSPDYYYYQNIKFLGWVTK